MASIQSIPPSGAHVVIAIVGSLGDLFPFLAIGQVLAARGHKVSIAAHGFHREAVEQAGLVFFDASGIAEPADRAAFTARAFHRWRGPGFVVHDLAACDVRESYRRLLPLCADADVLMTTTLAFAAQILGERWSTRGQLCWLSAVLAPAGFLSAFDPPATGIRWLDRYARGSARRGRLLQRVARWISREWTAPVRAFRRELGLPAQPPRGDPLHAGQHAPQGVLALYPAWLGAPQPDWPPAVHLTGFCRYAPVQPMDASLRGFLAGGSPPLVFSLGSTAVHAGLDFLRVSLEASVRLGQRALLFTGSPELRARLPATLPQGIHALAYAPHALVFARASVVIHHGGIGTSAEALHAGRPMLVVPHGFDQPDNAARLYRLGVAEVLPIGHYTVRAVVQHLQCLLDQPGYRQRALRCQERLQHANGAVAAAEVVEAAWAKHHRQRG